MTILSWSDTFSLVIILLFTLVYKCFRNIVYGSAFRFRIKFDWKEPCRVGKTVSFRVLIRKNSTNDTEARKLLSQINVEIKQNSEVLSILKENQETESDCVLVVKFSCRRAGSCRINITTGNQAIPGSPVSKNFLPEFLNIDKSVFLRSGHTIYCTTHEYKFLGLQIRDRFDNICRFEDLEWDDFKFTAKILDQIGCPNSSHYAYKFYPSGQRVGLKSTFKLHGIFECEVTYKDQRIPQGIFTMVAITNSERILLDNILSNNPGWTYHEAKLLAVGDEVQKRLKKIYIYVSPKQLYIRDYILRIFPIRVATFRVSHSTRVEVQFTNSVERTYTYAIYDGTQPRVTVEMDEKSARVVLAMFSHFLRRRMGGSESFTTKQKYFYDELVGSKNEVRISLILLTISRVNLVDSTMRKTKHFSGKDWCKNFKIQFEDEDGIDCGGLRREWLDSLCKNLFKNSKSGLFCCIENSRLVHPNSSQCRRSTWSLKHYEFAGKIVGKCLFESASGDASKQMVNGKFTRSFLAQILGLRPNYKHFEQDDPELFMGKIKFILESEDVEAMDLNFSEEEYSETGQLLRVVELIPNGSNVRVTAENKEEYLNAVANYRLRSKVSKEIESFLKGLHQIVPDDLLSNFDENELELLMCGKSEFDVKDLKQNYHEWCSPFDLQHKRVLNWFWTALANMSDDEKAKLLQFATGSSLLPHGGFKALTPKFSIRLGSAFGKLPTAHTCVNQICLSDNSSFEEFEKCLRLAIYEGCEGFGFK